MAASSPLTASAPHFCCPKWRIGSSLRLPSLGETRKLRASSRRYIQRIEQKAVLATSKPSIQFRCKAVSTTMEATVANESLLTGEEAVIIAAAAEAVALARAAVEVAKEAVQCFEKDSKSSPLASETVPDRFPSLNPLVSESVLNSFPSFISSESVLNPLSSLNPSLKTSSLASESVLTQPPIAFPPDPFEKPIEIQEIPLSADVVGSTRHNERRERRQRAAEKAAARAVPVKLSSRRKVRKFSERDFKDPVKLFKRVARSYKTLTAAEERELSEGVQDLLKLQEIQKQLRERNGEEPSFAMWAAACKMDQRTLHHRVDNGTRCKQRMVNSNIRLVMSIAKRYIGAGLPFEDIVQEGCCGLVKGVEKFDGSKGFKFSTYAYWWIKQAIRKALSERSRLIKLPLNMVNASYKVNAAMKQLKLSSNKGRPSHDEIAKLAGVSKKTVQSVLTLPKTPISFDSMIGNDYNVKLSETIPCRDEDSPEYISNKELKKSGLEMILDTLNPREKQVVSWRYGLDDGRAKTLQEVGDSIGISRERVRQVEASAFRKLKSKHRVEMLRKYINV